MENNKPVFYMLVGLPASGKSSESDRLGDVIVRSSDYLRDKLCGPVTAYCCRGEHSIRGLDVFVDSFV